MGTFHRGRSCFAGTVAMAIGATAWLAGCSDDTTEPKSTRAVAFTPPALIPAASVPSPGTAGEPIRYDRDIRPLLSDRCFKCHGPDGAKRQAELRLDKSEVAMSDLKGHTAIVPGSLEKSELWQRVSSTDPEFMMPPPTSNKRPLGPDERELMLRWIEEGARYEPHWSFVAPVRPPVPEVQNVSWCRNEIDRFIVAELERHTVAPGPEAGRETLLRRVTLDLTGLPPTLEEIDEFLNDQRPDAYERFVDRLMTQEPWRTRYAERMATPWLDAARYADTCGIHMDAGRTIWPYRDWVLKAFRQNMPFDRFLTEQLAGDLIPGATQDQKIASGFNRAHVTSDEGGAIAEEYLVEYAVDRAATTSSVFLGLTMGCARCHEHKFDPVSQEEFYRFYAFFDSIEEPGLYSQLPDPKRAFEPFLAIPTPEQQAALGTLKEQLEQERKELDTPDPREAKQRAAFFEGLITRSGLAWQSSQVALAESLEGATLTVQPDGSVLASGKNPDKDEHVITLTTQATDLRLLLLEALTDPSLPMGRVGRAENGNAVLSGVTAEAVSVADESKRQPVHFAWAWADHEQADGDYRAVNVLDASDDLGWAVDAHRKDGSRVAMLLAQEPFGFDGGTRLVVHLQYRTVYARHTFGRVRLGVGQLKDEGLAVLPSATSTWYLVGPFPADDGKAAFTKAFGPESESDLDLKHNFGDGNQFWHYVPRLDDDRLNGELAQGINATYVGRRLFVPSARTIEVSLGSDDGFRLFLNGKEIASKQVERALAANHDKATLELHAGANTLVMKVVNTGGAAGFYYHATRLDDELTGAMAAALLPGSALFPDLSQRLDRAWRETFSAAYRQRTQGITALDKQATELDAQIPRTMVMQELPKPRETFVLTRGQYDHPDKSRPVTRAVPAAFGKLAEGAPVDRLGLSQWLTAPENPLVARVAVNRMWEIVFGTGIVRTSEDFGQQGEWPSHPELLDWLAVEFREKGWDTQGMLRRLVTSSTYRQSSRARPELHERDPDNRWLSYFPRKRLGAEQIRDQALYVSGLLVEKFGGPSVKPYQPPGLWEEVAMPQSNTRVFMRGEGPDLWRRSLYTYWKRASPPPSMLTLDAPTRESCTIRRPSTDTPLQALALWNDEQFVEAARVLAERSLTEPGDDTQRLRRIYRRCTGRTPDESELKTLGAALDQFRARYRDAPEDAAKLLGVGASPMPAGADQAELAAWTLIANAMLNLDATINRG